MSSLTPQQRERLIVAKRQCKADFQYYAARALKIRTKSGSIEPFILNRAQLHIHDVMERQREATGKVRAIILKGRQQGCSTYIGGRFYHKTTHRFGWRTFILTHEDSATQNLFEMVNRYHDNNHVWLKPSTGTSNAKELYFDKLDSGYKIGTAHTKGTGRSSTIQCFHGSEVAFWANASDHVAGILQAVPGELDTELILESTANGLGNYFHQTWRDAESGKSEFVAEFVPWYWQLEYSIPVPEGFVLDTEESTYMESYGLTLGQMAWRRAKIVELKDPLLFKQEYPATSAEAFQVTGEETFIKAECILRARRYKTNNASGPVVVGYDPDAAGKDGASSIYRQGRVAFNIKRYHGQDAMGHVGTCKTMLDWTDPNVDMMFIDASADGVIARLWEMGYRNRVRAIHFGGAALDPLKYKNKRNEIWGLMDDWLNDELPVSIPDDDALHADLMSCRFKYDSNHNRVLESKEIMRGRGIKSPNDADALALTFAEPVRIESEYERVIREGGKKPYDPLSKARGGYR